MTPIAVITTVGSRDEAQALAKALVERKLAACVQISAIDSVFHWQDAVQSEPEYRLFCKTTRERYPAIEQAILALHSYELPAICALTFDPVYAPFADWIAAETR